MVDTIFANDNYCYEVDEFPTGVGTPFEKKAKEKIDRTINNKSQSSHGEPILILKEDSVLEGYPSIRIITVYRK